MKASELATMLSDAAGLYGDPSVTIAGSASHTNHRIVTIYFCAVCEQLHFSLMPTVSSL